MKMAKASKEEWLRVLDFIQALENEVKYPEQEDEHLGAWVRKQADALAGELFRVVFGYQVLVDNCCDPACDHLEHKPEHIHAQKALNYYRSAVLGTRPDYVPAKVRLPMRVRSDFDSFWADPGDHECTSNQWGAICVLANNGKQLGVKPAEFEVLEWRENK